MLHQILFVTSERHFDGANTRNIILYVTNNEKLDKWMCEVQKSRGKVHDEQNALRLEMSDVVALENDLFPNVSRGIISNIMQEALDIARESIACGKNVFYARI